MSKWVIDKQFSFCYGHRVWSQKLVEEFCETGDYACKCRHLHGHEGLVHVFLEGDTLERGMVTDFKHLGWMKNFIDTWLDHKFVIDFNDPMFETMVMHVYNDLLDDADTDAYAPSLYYDKARFFNEVLKPFYVPGTDKIAGRHIDLSAFTPVSLASPVAEVLEGFTIVDFVPTSENFSKWLWECATEKMNTLGITVAQVDWFETPKSRSSYRA